MDNPTGKIESITTVGGALRALVEVDAESACPRCAAGNGCGAGLFTSNSGGRKVEAIVAAHLSVAQGDTVELSLASENLLRAALLVYGLPLLGAIAAAGLAFLLRLGDAAAAVAAILGLAIGLLVSRRLLRHSECIERFVPYVEKRLQSPRHGR
jgi:sigma-E factor negative regulatory protein RseC